MITRSAGVVEVCASLQWQSQADVPREDLLPGGAPGALSSMLVESIGADGTSRFVEGEIRGFDSGRLAEALSHVLRALTSKAALSEAVLETRAVWSAVPRVAQGAAVDRIARDLWGAGFRVTFGASWTPVADADVAVGTAGSTGELENFFQGDSSWKVTPRHS